MKTMLLHECCEQIRQASEAMNQAETLAGRSNDLEQTMTARIGAEKMARRILSYLGNIEDYKAIRGTDQRAADIFLSFTLFQDWEQVKKYCGEDSEEYLINFDNRNGEIL